MKGLLCPTRAFSFDSLFVEYKIQIFTLLIFLLDFGFFPLSTSEMVSSPVFGKCSFLKSEQQLDCALDLMRRLPPQSIEENLAGLIDLVSSTPFVLTLKVPSLCEDLLSSIDQPLKIAKDRESKRDFLLCDYNRDGDSYRLGSRVKLTERSPWSNTYDPPIDDGNVPSDRLRELEIQVNDCLGQYLF